MPVQLWATWFPKDGKPQSFIQGFPLAGLELSARGRDPFHFRIGNNEIQENSCRGALEVRGHSISWDLRFHSTFRVTLSSKGWIGFSRTPHSDALFSGQITLDGRRFQGDPLGFGVQGHNCGYRHRKFWRWAHAYFLRPNGAPSTFEVLVYEMPLGLVFRKAVLWHNAEQRVFSNLREIRRDQENLRWDFRLFHARWIRTGSCARRLRRKHASFALRKNRLSGQLGSDEQQPGKSDTLPEATRRIGREIRNDYWGGIGDGRPVNLTRRHEPSRGARRRWRTPTD